MATCSALEAGGVRIGAVFAATLVLAFFSAAAGQELRVATDQGGGIHELAVGGERLAIRTSLNIPTKGWTRPNSQGQASDIKQAGQRFFFVKQFCNLTPAKADALEVSSDHPKVLLTAFTADAGKPGDARRIYTLHVANLGLGRTATITGLPVSLKQLRAVRTSESESSKELDPVKVEQGTVHLDLAAESMLTLTTMQP